MNNKKIKVKSATVTIGMNILIFIVFILCLEIILRIFGYGHSSGRIYFQPENGTFNRTILCVGDSFTYGGNVKSNEIYPFYLRKLLVKDKKANIRIVNRGYCERNSTQLFDELSGNIKKYKPEIVIFLAGSSERTNLIGSHPGDKRFYHSPEEDEIKRLRSEYRAPIRTGNLRYFLVDVVRGARAYRMFKNVVWEMKYKFICWNIKRNKLINLLSSCYNQETFSGVLDRLGEYYHYSSNYDMALELALKVIEQSPIDYGQFEDMGYYWLLSWAYEFQNKDASYVFERLKRILSARPEYKNNVIFMRYYKMFANKEASDEYHEIKFVANMRKIIQTCRDNNIIIILQNYPQGFPAVNKHIQDLAQEYKIPLVDNYSIFSELIKKNGKHRYLIGDGHCKPEGYKVMAQNVYILLNKYGLP